MCRKFTSTATKPMPAYIAGQYVNVLHDNKEVSPLSIACAPRADGGA